jgi:glutamyl-tRNA reductase
MHNNFRLLSLTYKNAPVEIREMVAMSESESSDFLIKLKSFTSIQEALVLSTCNRTEIYYAAEDDLSDKIIGLMRVEKAISDGPGLEQYFTSVRAKSAMRHLFHVAVGLDSQVIGDMQVTNQVKKAYQASADNEMAGPFLHRLLHTIFFTNKRVVQETPFRDGAASVSYSASELVYDLASEIIKPRVLIIGLGEIGADTCKNIGDSDSLDKLFKVTVINRTQSKADALALKFGFATRPYEEVNNAIQESDIVISAVSLQDPLITPDLFKTHDKFSHKYLIDLSVPRSVSSDVDEIPGILVFNIDDIRNKADEAMRKRINAIPHVQEIIEGALADMENWVQEMEVSPTIHRLKGALEQIRQDEISRYLKNLDAKEADHVDKITKGIMQKIIKLPVLQLKAACKRGEAETLIDVLNNLFDLERQQASKLKSGK